MAQLRRYTRPLFTKRTKFLPKELMKSQSPEIGCHKDHIAMKFDRHNGSAAAEVPVKLQSDQKSLNHNLVALRHHEMLWQNARPLSE